MSMLQTEHGYRRPLPPPRKAPEKKSGDVVRSLVGVARFILARPEPAEVDANLDAAGEAALAGAIRALRARNCIVVVVSHRPNALAALDMAMILVDGRIQAFGPRDTVFTLVQAAPAAGKGGPHVVEAIHSRRTA